MKSKSIAPMNSVRYTLGQKTVAVIAAIFLLWQGAVFAREDMFYSLRPLAVGEGKTRADSKGLKILLINPADEFGEEERKRTAAARENSIPLGLASILASLRKYSADTGLPMDLRVIDAPALGYGFDQTASVIKDFNPDIVGINTVTPTVNVALRLVQAAKSFCPGAVTILGGIHVTTSPETIKKEGVDIIARGYAEATICRVADALSRSHGDKARFFKGLTHVRGLVFKDPQGRVTDTDEPDEVNMSGLPMPAYDMFSLEKYLRWGRPAVGIESTRYCGRRCTFCAIRAMHSGHIIERPPEEYVAIIEYLYREYGVTYFNDVGDNFAADYEYARRVADLIEERGLHITLDIFARADDISRNPKVLDELKRIGVGTIFIGVESGDPGILKAYKKGLQLADVEKALELVSEKGFVPMLGFMVGAIDDNEATIQASIDFANRLKQRGLFVLHPTITTPYPGTEFGRQARELGLIFDDNFDHYGGHARGKVIMRTRFLSGERVYRLYEKMLLEFYTPEYIESLKSSPGHLQVVREFIEIAQRLRSRKNHSKADHILHAISSAI